VSDDHDDDVSVKKRARGRWWKEEGQGCTMAPAMGKDKTYIAPTTNVMYVCNWSWFGALLLLSALSDGDLPMLDASACLPRYHRLSETHHSFIQAQYKISLKSAMENHSRFELHRWFMFKIGVAT
jgi:hypothetical protein